ncbi:hypothetical protein EGN69_14750 [Pseudomonas monteilii]|nr:hypothetical protein EGN69_14750 [Pseudomonas monteilii]
MAAKAMMTSAEKTARSKPKTSMWLASARPSRKNDGQDQHDRDTERYLHRASLFSSEERQYDGKGVFRSKG